MATWRSALNGLTSQLSPLYTGFSPTVQIGLGWPSLKTIQDVAKGSLTACALYDGDGTRNVTRWMGKTFLRIDQSTAPGLTVALSGFELLPGGTLTVTLGGTPATSDAVVLSLQPLFSPSLLANAIASAGETLSQLATALAASVNAAAVTGITASALGAVVTLAAAGTATPTPAGALTGNLGTRTYETMRLERHIRVIFWCQTETIREAVMDPTTQLIGQLEDSFGYSLAPSDVSPAGVAEPGDWVRVKYLRDMPVEEEQLKDVYRWDLRLSLEYGTPLVQTLYPVLGTSLTFNVTPGALNA